MPKSTQMQNYPVPELLANPKSSDWKYFKRQIENDFLICNAAHHAKLPMLLNCLRRDGLAIYDGLPEPKSDFLNAIKQMDSYF